METKEEESVMENMQMETDVKDEIKDVDNDSSSDESDDENVDDEDQNKLIEQVQVLEKELEKSPYMYDKHVELVNLLRRLKLRSKLRSARQLMSNHFPLTEELWLEWLEDEEDDEDFALELLNKAVEDYQSVKLWLEMAFYQMRKSSSKTPNNTTPSYDNNTELVREVFERGLSRVALHCTEAPLLWDSYRDFEMVTPCGENGEEEKCKKVVALLVRQLCCPLMGLSNIYNKYMEIVGEVDQVVQGHYKRSTTLLNKIMPFEKSLKENESVEAYNNYIQHLSDNNPDPNLVVCVYERAVKVHCLQPSLWLSYLDYLSKHLHIDTVLTPVCKRAVRNCPWSVLLWIKFLTTLEAFKAPHETVKATFTEAQAVGLSQPHEHLSLWTCYLDYHRRRISTNTTDNKNEVAELRQAFDDANKQLMQAFSHAGDPQCSLLQYQAFVEAKHLGDMNRCRELYAKALKSPIPKQHHPWLQYAQLERSYGDVKGARRVYQMALNSVGQEGVEWVMEAFVRFEREEGDLENYEKALEKCEAQMKRILERRVKEKDKESKYKNRQQLKASKKGGAKQKDSKTSPNKRPSSKYQQQHNSYPHQQSHSNHPKPPNNHDKGDSVVVVKPYQKTRPIVFDRNDSEAPSHQPPNNGGFKVPLPPPGFAEHKKKMMKRSKPDDDDDGAIFGSGDGENGGSGGNGGFNTVKKLKGIDGSTVTTNEEFLENLTSTTATSTTPTTPTTPATLSDLCTVFVSNLDYAVTREDLCEALKEAGSVKEVRLVANNKGQSKGYAYVEFKEQASASQALQMDRKTLQGRPMFISKFKKAGKKDDNSDNNPFKFGDRLEKNKLFVKDLATSVSQQDLHTLFQTVGELKNVRIATYRNGRSKGHAYIEFVKEESAAVAVIKLDRHMLKEQPISVAISNPPARNQRSKDVPMSAAHVPSLGGGKKEMGRKSQLSMLPRNLQVAPATSKPMSNQDFRNMLLQKK